MPTRSVSPGLFADTPASSSTGQTGWVTAHCDGGARGNPGPAGYGAVLTGPAGEPLAELSEFLGFRTNNYAEYSGLLAVLEYALAHGHRRLRVVSDSELMVKQIQGKYRVNSSLYGRRLRTGSPAWMPSRSPTPFGTRTRTPTGWPTRRWTVA
jgi:probable phosphoglycerate mutase